MPPGLIRRSRSWAFRTTTPELQLGAASPALGLCHPREARHVDRQGARRPDIQGLRALAVIVVVLFHAGLPISGGFVGVDVFFVISGFVITGSLVGELRASGGISLRRFYARRVKRLFPALALVVVAVAVVGTLAGPAATQRTGAITGVFASLFTANMYLYSLGSGYFDASTSLNPLLHTWTLAVEEQIYLVFPLVALAGWRWARGSDAGVRRLTTATLIASVSAASFLYSLELSRRTINESVAGPAQLAFYSAPTRVWEFGAGALLLLASPLLVRLPELGARILGLVGFGAIVGAALWSAPTSNPATTALLPVLGTCAVLAAGTVTCAGSVRLLSGRGAVWIGDRSYGWYLWHWPLIVFAVAAWPGSPWIGPTAALISLGAAWLSYRVVENPIRHSPRIAGRAVVGLALVCMVVPAAACIGNLAVGRALAATPAMTSWRESRSLHADKVRGCDNRTPLGSRVGGRCTWSVPSSRGRIVLFGDSNAGHFTEPVVRAGNGAGFDVTVATFASCPFVALPLSGTECQQFAERTVDTLVRMKPSLVIVAARTDLYLASWWPRAKDGLTAPVWQRALATTLAKLNRAGVPVLLVHPIPQLPQAPDGCSVIRVLTSSCESSVERAETENDLRRAVTSEESAAATTPLTWTIDLDDDLCGPSRCSTTRAGVVMYRDDVHLSIQGALSLTPRFARSIAAHARTRAKVSAERAQTEIRPTPVNRLCRSGSNPDTTHGERPGKARSTVQLPTIGDFWCDVNRRQVGIPLPESERGERRGGGTAGGARIAK